MLLLLLLMLLCAGSKDCMAAKKPELSSRQYLLQMGVYQAGAEKISLCFELPHRSGTLYSMLGNFIFNDVNMRMIESRPIPEESWQYRFFVDIEGNLEDAGVQNALYGIMREAKNVKILGNY